MLLVDRFDFSAQPVHNNLRNEEFQEWKIEKTPTEKWLLTCTDGNDNVLHKQEIGYSDFPVDSAVIWKESDVLLLSSEH